MYIQQAVDWYSTCLQVLSSDEFPSLVIQGRVHIQLQVILQQPPKAFQNTSVQVTVMLLFEQLLSRSAQSWMSISLMDVQQHLRAHD